MKHKLHIFTKIESIETQIDYIIRQLNSKNISPKEIIDILKNHQNTLDQIRSLIEVEA